MKLDPSYTNAYYTRGCCYEKMDIIDQAIEDFSQTLRMDPEHVNAAYARGAAENKRGNFAKAIDDYNMALLIDTKKNSHYYSPA